VNGKTIDDASQFRRVIADSKIGTTATLHIVHSGRSADLRVPVESSSSTASRRRR
jgi:S1-C subfamily serine protease